MKDEIHAVWIHENYCCTCTIAMHSLFGRSVYKHLCTVQIRQDFSESVVDITRASSRASISTLVQSVKVLEGSFKEERGRVLQQSYLTAIAL